MTRLLRRSTLFPYTTLFRSLLRVSQVDDDADHQVLAQLPVLPGAVRRRLERGDRPLLHGRRAAADRALDVVLHRSEEHTSELQSHSDLVCRLLLEKKKHDIS